MDEELEADLRDELALMLRADTPVRALLGFNAHVRFLAEDPANAVLRDVVEAELKKHQQALPDAHRARFLLGLLYRDNHLLDHAIEMFQETRKDRELVLESYRMLGRCFSEKVGFNMEDLAVKQYRKGIETRGFRAEEYNELRYELALLLARRHENGVACELFRQVHAIDPTLHDVQQWVDWCGSRGGGDDGGNAPVPLITRPRSPAAGEAHPLPERPAGE